MPGVPESAFVNTFWGVVLGGLIATAAPVVVEWLRGKREAALDAAKRASDRKIESDRLQRDTLLELQERMTEWMRETALADHEDRAILAKVGQITQRAEGSGEAEFTIGRRMMYLTERVKDDHLRTQLAGLRKAHTASEMYRLANHDSVTVGWLEDDILARTRQFSQVAEELGEVLRRYL